MNKLNFIAFMSLAASTLVVVTACSSDDEKPTATSGGTQEYAQALCNFEAKCVPLELEIEFGDVNGCITAFDSEAATAFSLNGVTITNGQLSACANAISGASCATNPTTLAACNPSGSLAVGAGCSDGIQCSSGYCATGTTSTTSTTGTSTETDTTDDTCGKCAARTADGGACTDDESCNAGSGCDVTKQVCAPRPGSGAACSATGVDCQDGFRCINSVCAAPVAAGGTCDDSQNQCAANLACVSSKCTDETASITIADIGATCGVDITTQKEILCKNGSCVGAQGSQKCVARAAQGQACNDGSADAPTSPDCAFGLDCKNGTCQKNDPTLCK